MKKNLSANQRCPPFRVSVNWREYCIIIIFFAFIGSTASVVPENQIQDIQKIKVELAEVKDQLASLEAKSSNQEWMIDSLHCEIAELRNDNSQYLKEMAIDIQILKDHYLKK